MNKHTSVNRESWGPYCAARGPIGGIWRGFCPAASGGTVTFALNDSVIDGERNSGVVAGRTRDLNRAAAGADGSMSADGVRSGTGADSKDGVTTDSENSC